MELKEIYWDRSVKEAVRVISELGYKNQLPMKIKSFNWNHEWITIKILKLVFNQEINPSPNKTSFFHFSYSPHAGTTFCLSEAGPGKH